MLNTGAFEVDNSSVAETIHGTIYRKKSGLQPISENECHGWASKGHGNRYEVFRSRNDRRRWVTAKEFRDEYSELKKNSFDKFFTSRKGFQLAEPRPGARAWYQGAKRRFLRVWNEHLVPVPFKHEMI